MAIDVEPVEGSWYQYLDKGQKFEVLDVDEENGVVEIQYLDGDIDEINLDEWYDLEVAEIDEPDEWDEEEDDDDDDLANADEEDEDDEEWEEDDDDRWDKKD
jgi:hypothetical protein